MTLYNQLFKKVLASKFAMILMFLAGHAAISSAQATADITIDDFTVGSGDYYTVQVKLKSSELVINPQFDIKLPDNLYFWGGNVEKGELLNRNHSLSVNQQPNGDWRFVITSALNKPLNATEGVLVSFEVYANDIFDGTIDIKNKSMKTDRYPREEIYPADSKTSVKSVAIINGVTDFSVNPEKVNVTIGEQFNVDVNLTNDWNNVDRICSLEAELSLPEGISLVEDADGNIGYTDRIPDGVTIEATQTEAGKYKIVMTSLTNKPILEMSGALFVLRMKADEAFGAAGEVVLSNIILAAKNGAGRYIEEPLKILLVNKDKADAAKEELKAALETAKAASTEGMTEKSVKALTDAIAAAEPILADAFANAEDLVAAKNALDAAVAGLCILDPDTYYIKNVAKGLFLGAGNSWGTHAVVNADGLDYILAIAEGKYTINSQVSNGGQSYYLNGEWNDGAAMGWTLAKTENGEFTISNGTQFLTANDEGLVTLTDAASEASNWVFVTPAERQAGLATATVEAPADATFLIPDANFSRNDLRKSAWTKEAANMNLSGGNNVNNVAESYHSAFALSQKLANAPKGFYAMTVQGFYRQDGEDNEHLPYFFVNDEKVTFPVKTGSENSMSNASESFTKGNYTTDPIFIEVTEDGELTIGAKLEENASMWCVWDNFRLTYYGTEANLEELKSMAIKAELAELTAKATELKEQVEIATSKTELETAITTAAAATDVEAIKAAIALLKTAINNAETFTSAKAVLDNMKQLIDATNVYTQEAYDQYYGQWIAKYNDGTITKDEVAGLQDPFLVTGWHANITVDNFLLSAWDTNPDFQNAPYYINSWSVEGDTDGSNFRVPFFEYWTGDGDSLGERTLTATMENQEAGTYNVTALVRVRIKNGASAPTYGITMNVNDGEAVDVAAGEQVGTSQMYLKEYTATGVVGEDGVLKIKFNVAADNNISWLSFKNVKFEKGATPEDPELVAPEGWTNLIANGNLAGDDVTSYVSKEAPSADIVGSAIVAGAGKNGTRGIVVKSADDPAQAWDTQFWIVLSEPLTVNTKLHVEFDYAANKAAKASTQAHAGAGQYLHWAMIGDINFTEEWQHFSTDVTVDGSMAGMQSIAFNLAEEKTATEYRFDNFGVWAQIAPKPAEWSNIIVNSDMEGESMECFYVTEQGVGGPFVAVATAGIGKDGSKAVKVQSADDPAQAWDTQFFIRLPYQLPAGTSYKVSFDYKATEAAKSTTQMHGEPGAYIHWAGIGDVNFTGEWQSFELESAITADQSKEGQLMQSIAFNLAELKTANTYIFDNVKFFVPKDVVSTLTKNPAVDPNPYPVGIRTINVENNNNTIFNLNGQKVQKAQKGIYIINGKKVNLK